MYWVKGDGTLALAFYHKSGLSQSQGFSHAQQLPCTHTMLYCRLHLVAIVLRSDRLTLVRVTVISNNVHPRRVVMDRNYIDISFLCNYCPTTSLCASG